MWMLSFVASFTSDYVINNKIVSVTVARKVANTIGLNTLFEYLLYYNNRGIIMQILFIYRALGTRFSTDRSFICSRRCYNSGRIVNCNGRIERRTLCGIPSQCLNLLCELSIGFSKINVFVLKLGESHGFGSKLCWSTYGNNKLLC